MQACIYGAYGIKTHLPISFQHQPDPLPASSSPAQVSEKHRNSTENQEHTLAHPAAQNIIISSQDTYLNFSRFFRVFPAPENKCVTIPLMELSILPLRYEFCCHKRIFELLPTPHQIFPHSEITPLHSIFNPLQLLFKCCDFCLVWESISCGFHAGNMSGEP